VSGREVRDAAVRLLVQGLTFFSNIFNGQVARSRLLRKLAYIQTPS
jgi:hypothetical protein